MGVLIRPLQHGANGKTLTCNKEVLQSETESLDFSPRKFLAKQSIVTIYFQATTLRSKGVLQNRVLGLFWAEFGLFPSYWVGVALLQGSLGDLPELIYGYWTRKMEHSRST